MFNVDALTEQQERIFTEGQRVACRRTGCWVQMRSADQPEFRKKMKRRFEALRKSLGLIGRRSNDPIPAEHQDKVDDLILTGICEDLLLAWGDVVDKDGNPIEFSPALALEVARKLVAFKTDLLEGLGDLSDWEALLRESVSGN